MGVAYRLIYPRDLPKNRAAFHWRVRYNQKKAAVRCFGELPPSLRVRIHAYVTITRVQGKGQRELDTDNLIIATKGLRDALKHCGYIVDDRPSCATFVYREDSRRRHLGPRVEVEVNYA